MKNVLVIHYSQSGQLTEIAQNIAKPLVENPELNVSFHTISPVKPYPFPWNKDTFFDVFPESFLQIPTELNPIPNEILDKKYDLILFSYQVWYLTPSIPANSFLKSSQAKKLLENTPVVTIIACRNMWALAQEKVKKLLKANNADLKGNLAFIDRAGNLISVVTIVDWMFSGIKKKYLGIFPLPGVSQKDINEADKFGKIINESLSQNNFENLQEKFVENNGVYVSPYLVNVDKKGNFIFSKWSKFISKRKNTRSSWLKVFYVYLFIAIWVISPIVYILHVLTYPLTFQKRKKAIKYYQSV
ncbi:dialkylrecorsinol condensing enzyme DarA [Flavobacterium macacae]|uniref:Dialkylresorcinol condensing enzyme DarA n=1 Tax=Flavobacterium macacae TaxID=2488993 RepID=A0A3P3WHE6_9FLAO|nr:dialkylrecorsinol condensing enzyme DarA [Flavobacterium macacae]RRJ94018.1 dialkylresorcinol condensing enzyme DarA [Flavobacterium macacae]